MQKTKLYGLIFSFSPSERKGFRSFLNSPFFNRDPVVVVLFETMILHFTDCLKEKIWEHLFPQEPYNSGRWRKLMNKLSELSKEFLIQISLNNDEMQKQLLLLPELNQRKRDKNFASQFTQLRKRIDHEQCRGSTYYAALQRMEIENQIFIRRTEPRRHRPELAPLISLVEIEFALKWLRLQCLEHNLGNIFKIREGQSGDEFRGQNKNPNEWIRLLVQKNTQVHSLGIYWSVFNYFEEGQNEYLKQGLEGFLENIEAFPPIERGELFGILSNILLYKVAIGHREFLEKAYSLYLMGIEEHIVFDGKEISPWIYKNYVELGLSLGNFGEVEQFIGQYSLLLPLQFKNNYHQYSLGQLAYSLKKYDEVAGHITLIDEKDLFLDLNVRSLQIKTAYRLGDDEIALHLIQRFTMYLRKNRVISQHHKQIWHDRLYYWKKLIKCFGKEQFRALKDSIINDQERIIDKQSFLSLVEEKEMGSPV